MPDLFDGKASRPCSTWHRGAAGHLPAADLDIGNVAAQQPVPGRELADVKPWPAAVHPARLTVVIAGTPADGSRAAPEVPRPPVRPAPAQPGETQTVPQQQVPGVTPPSKPADNPVAGAVTAPNAAKKP